jgi:HEAT repeat protein
MEAVRMTLSRSLALALLVFCPALGFAAAPPTRIDSNRVTVLLGLLDDEEFEVRKNADDELRRMGKAVIPYLREEQLRSASLEVRDRLKKIVRDLGADEGVPTLIQQLTHEDARFRQHAAFALGRLTPDHLPALEAALRRGPAPQAKHVLERVIAELRR